MHQEFTTYQAAAVDVAGFPYQAQLDELLEVLQDNAARNAELTRFYECDYSVGSVAIEVPKGMRAEDFRVCWPTKAVDELAVRSRFDGFSAKDEAVSEILDGIVRENYLKGKYRQAVQSQLTHGCSFLTLSTGGGDEPSVIVSTHSAESAAAVWDRRRGRIAYGLVVADYDDNGNPTAINLYNDEAVCMLTFDGAWSFEIIPHRLGQPPMGALRFRPTDRRPFGQSRISHSVKGLSVEASHESLRTAVQSEFYSRPQKYMLGVDRESAEAVSKFDRYMDAWIYSDRDENGNVPQIGMLQPAPMNPHLDYMRTLAAQFSGVTNIPVSTLGVLHDQQASAESIYAASEGLIIAAQDLNELNRSTLENLARMAVALMRTGRLSDLTADELDIVANFANPAMPSIVSQADAMVKLASVVDGLAETDVFLEQSGFNEDIRRRVQSERREAQSRAVITSALFGGDDASA